mgnify:CR=1 FL=1
MDYLNIDMQAPRSDLVFIHSISYLHLVNLMNSQMRKVVPSNISACERAGKRMWMHIDAGPVQPYTNIRLDDLLLDARVLFWQVFQLNLTGYTSPPPSLTIPPHKHFSLTSDDKW